jgi:hypothetical protein
MNLALTILPELILIGFIIFMIGLFFHKNIKDFFKND